MIAFPYIAHHATAVAGTVRHQYRNRQSADDMRLQCAESFIGSYNILHALLKTVFNYQVIKRIVVFTKPVK